jgi:YihY family inner membrane protein
VGGFGSRYSAFDRFQQRHRSIGFPLAVLQKYADDQGGYHAATITYYGFFAIFPLLLVLTTVLGFILQNHPHLEQRIVDSALGQFPVIGPQLSHGSLHGSTLALVLGLAAALWAGMGVFLASQNAMNHLWGVPFKRRPDPLHARGRALLLLLLLGGGALAATILAALATVGARFGLTWKIGSLALSTALNIGLFWLGFRLLTAREVSWRQLRGGAIAAGVLYELLQTLGGYYVGHTLKHASNVYGTFGLVIGLLSWIYLSAHITLLAAESNVVATRRLWPRSFSLMIEQPATQADKRAFTQRGKVEERRQDQTVSIDFPAAEQTETTRTDPGSSDADQRPSASRGRAKLALPTRTDAAEEATRMAYHQDIGEWHGKTLVDRDGERIGTLVDVYVDVETNEPMFGTVKEGLIGRHLTFVPLAGITIGPDNLQVTVSKEQIESAPNIELHGDELSRSEESTLYHHYQLNYTPPDTERGRRLARR